jgi:type I restriction enzyme S subunit
MSKSELMKLEIQLPSFEEQIRISESLSVIDDKIQIENEVLKKYILQKNYLLKNLFK